MRIITAIFFLFLIINTASSQTAPDFTITTFDNETKSLYADYLDNGKTVLLDIFFTTCPVCTPYSLVLEDFYQEWGGGDGDLEIIALSNQSWNNNASVAAYAAQYGHTFPGAGADGGALEALAPYINGDFGQFLGTPTFIVIAPDRTVEFDIRASGGVDGRIAAIDDAILATGAIKPIVTFNINGTITTPSGNNVTQVVLNSDTGLSNIQTDDNGTFDFSDIPIGNTYTITPSKDTDLTEGLSVGDIVMIRQHLLSIDEFTEDYQFIAADANNNGFVSVSDIVEIQRAILEVSDSFTNNTSWRFLPESITVSSPEEVQNGLNFTAIKIGDVNNTVN